MHHLSLATLNEFAQEATDEDRALITSLVEQRAVVASGFSEGVTGGNVFIPTMTATRNGSSYIVNGSKKPCSLSSSMDLLTASVEVDTGERAIALIPAGTPGISVRPFWESWILAGAESDEVHLEDVEVPADLVLLNGADDPPDGRHEMTGYLWFGMLVTANYLGAASALLERLLAAGKDDYEGYVRAAADVENAMAAIENIAPRRRRRRTRTGYLGAAAVLAYRDSRRTRPRVRGGRRIARRDRVHHILRHRLPYRRRPRIRLPPAVTAIGLRIARQVPRRRRIRLRLTPPRSGLSVIRDIKVPGPPTPDQEL